jgi:hypothetical protein
MYSYHKIVQNTDRIARIAGNVGVRRTFVRSVYGVVY